ncbi:MAG: hypothetical protein H7X97_05960, partial [Opitutaceae bacterium]|nr:hypothetical protein [Verrucomicrobiales bacterium]
MRFWIDGSGQDENRFVVEESMEARIPNPYATTMLRVLLAVCGVFAMSGFAQPWQASPVRPGSSDRPGGTAAIGPGEAGKSLGPATQPGPLGAGSPGGDGGTNGLRLQINRGFANFNLSLINTEERSFYSVRRAADPGFGQWLEVGYLLGALGTNVTPATLSKAEDDMAFFIAKKDVKNIQIELPQTLSQANALTVNINGGPAIAMAVLVNDTNTTSAVWTDFTRSPNVALGNSNGTYQVRMGFAFADGTTNWITREITIDSEAPELFVSGPQTGIVTKPVLQIAGYTSKPVASISYDVSHATGTLSNQTGQVTGQFFDTNTLSF